MRVAGSSARESRSVVSLFPPAPPGTNDQLSPIRSSRPKFFGQGGVRGRATWFESIGMKPGLFLVR